MDIKLKSKINQLYDKGLSLREIGNALGISHQTVRTAIPDNNIRRKRMNPRRMQQVYSTFLKTDSYQETAEAMNLRNRQTAYRIVKIMEREPA